MRAQIASTDLIRELRLRNWARKNYVGPEARGKHWHPIVLEEMSFRDAELAEAQSAPAEWYSPFVPLEPVEQFYLDAPHAGVPAPKLAEACVSSRKGDRTQREAIR